MGYIYKITNKVDQKVYIGQTSRDLELRWKEHKKKGSNCKYLKAAIENHGVENFKFELICISFDENLNDLEMFYIKKYNSLVPLGYNLRNGGNNGKLNEETKKKISESLKLNKTKPINKSFLGRKHTEETKKLISNQLIGKCMAENTRQKMIASRMNGRQICQYDLSGKLLNKFNSFKEICEKLNFPKSSILGCCLGNSKTSRGFVWKYEKNENETK
jgi:group I intron endonuclease